MQVSNRDIENIMGPGIGRYNELRFKLAQALLRVQAGHNAGYRMITHLTDLGLIGDNGIVKKGRLFLFEQLSVKPA